MKLLVSSSRGWHLLALLLIVLTGVLAPPCMAAAQEASPGFDDIVRQATEAREARDVPSAIRLYGEAVRLNPQWPDGWWFLGTMEYGNDSYAEARNALTRYIELTPNATAAFALRGLCEFELAEYTQSLQDIQRALALGAANQSRNEQILQYHEALLLTRLGRFEVALQIYGFFAHNGITSPEIFLGLGIAGLRSPTLPQDVEASRRELFSATGVAAYLALAGEEEKAQQAFERLFEQFPAEANAHYLYGYLLFAKYPDRAVKEFKRAEEIAPSNASAPAMIAWSSLVQNKPLDAVPYAEKAVKNDSSLPLAQLVLGRSLVETGELKSGIQHLEVALKLEPTNLEAHLALAKGYSEAGRAEDARRERLLCLQITKHEANPVAH